MPRLLLVDDNQRIHQIAATLLNATDIELTCASSGAEALDLLAAGASFDVALVDTTMQGMDGWELLARLRGSSPTALMPVAMMAGVLEVVDPETVRRAPIQGFLKKPVELRSDLPDRVHALMAMPVEPAEPEPEPATEPPVAVEAELEAAPETTTASFATLPYLRPSDHGFPDERDLLILEPGDLLLEDLPEPAAAAAPEEGVESPFETFDALEVAEVPDAPPAPETPGVPDTPPQAAFEPSIDSLELEELDLESLKDLNHPVPEAMEEPREPAPNMGGVDDLPDFSLEDTLPGDEPDQVLVTEELPDLGPSLDLGEPFPAERAPEPPSPEAALPEDWSDESETLLELSETPAWSAPSWAGPADFGPDSFLDSETTSAGMTPSFLPESADQATPLQVPEPMLESIPEPILEPVPVNGVPAEISTVNLGEDTPAEHAASIPPEPPSHAPGAGDPLAAILADPVLVDRLAKAVVARLGDRILREIAWEIMPEMADRMHRN